MSSDTNKAPDIKQHFSPAADANAAHSTKEAGPVATEGPAVVRRRRSRPAPDEPATSKFDKPLLKTTLAAEYCGYETPAGLFLAWKRKEVEPYGRRGEKGTWLWARTELDRFLRAHGPGSKKQ
ncbi:hypothetical protein LVJ94_35455 [Pendulispora rubella]|uniref:Helix-turn-helix domain-containing protein n=1 Tax=Pendulispora rubella TaxID=2741070 RepID=A0ABZ2KYY3_9BACT